MTPEEASALFLAQVVVAGRFRAASAPLRFEIRIDLGDFSPSLLIQEGPSLSEVPAVGTVGLLLLVGALAGVGFLALCRLV